MKAETPHRARRPFSPHRLRESEIMYRTLFDNATDGIFLMKGVSHGLQQDVPDYFRVYQGADYRTNARSIFSPLPARGENSKVKALEMEKAATAGELQSFEWKHFRYDGSLFDAEVSLTRVQVNEDTVLLRRSSATSAAKEASASCGQTRSVTAH